MFKITSPFLGFALGTSIALASHGPGPKASVDMSFVSTGTFKRVGGYRPYSLALSATPPSGIKRSPVFKGSVLYGAFHFGSGVSARSEIVAVEEPIDENSRIFFDANADGDLTETPPIHWTAHHYTGRDGTEQVYYDARLTAKIEFGGHEYPAEVTVYPSRGADLGYYGDFSLQGKISLGGVAYDAIYWDSLATWDPSKNDGTLMIDTDHDGKFHPGYEFFAPNQPFNIKGTTYELKESRGDLLVAKSSKSVKERTLADAAMADPNLSNGLRPGKSALAFSRTTMDGRSVEFPSSFAGKIVMLDFWATWCGPCMNEAPNVVKAYAKFHNQGFEILGVSLDSPKAETAIAKTTSHVGMTWPQIYDGKAWEGALIKQYGIKAIPATYLVDGDTGKIIAMLDDLRGNNLELTVAKALAVKVGSKANPSPAH